jgi:hypothetical protein
MGVCDLRHLHFDTVKRGSRRRDRAASGDVPIAEICRALAVSRATFYRYANPLAAPRRESQILTTPIDARPDVAR